MSDIDFHDVFDKEKVAKLTAVNPVDVRVAAMNLLSRREHTRKELSQKLHRRFDDLAVIDAELDKLKEENLQSDSRFAESFVRMRFARGYGPLRIRQEMRQKGIADDNIQAAMTAEDFDWYVSAEDVLNRKYGASPARELKEKARRVRFMQYRGFSGDHYKHLL